MNYDNLKVLTIKDFYFKLPDDFDGGLSDALRLYADYHDEVKNTDKHTNDPVNKELSDTDIEMWYGFLDIIEGGNKKMIGNLSISECKYDEDGVYKMENVKDFDTK